MTSDSPEQDSGSMQDSGADLGWPDPSKPNRGYRPNPQVSLPRSAGRSVGCLGLVVLLVFLAAIIAGLVIWFW